MKIWLIRAGSHGEFEAKFLQEERVYVTWDHLDINLAALPARSDLISAMTARYPNQKPKAILNWASQVWPFAQVMEKGDWVVVPLKFQAAVYIGEIVGDYQFSSTGPDPFYHWRQVKWIGEDIPRSHFGQDLLHSFGAFMTICRIQRNNAEERIKKMRAKNWAAESIADLMGAKSSAIATDDDLTEAQTADLEEQGQDQIASLIEARFKGHHLTRLVEAILQAKGYATWRSQDGPDGGADILAGNGIMGFGQQRICVEVKSESGPIDRPTVDKLLGAMSKFNATEGLFVSWSGFKGNVQKELASSFFRLRLWGRKELMEELFANYDKLNDELKAELPLKRIWAVAKPEEAMN